MDKGLEERICGLLGAMPLRLKKLFGISAWFMWANDQMFAGVWGDGVMLRLGQEESTRLVDCSGRDLPSTLKSKITQDASNFIRSIIGERGRNATALVETVTLSQAN
jgi:hypothetical protein